MSTIRHHIEMTHLDSGGNKYILYPKNNMADVHTNSTSGVTIEGKVNFYGTCTTAAVTAAKTATISGFTLVQGQHVTIAFTNGITVASPTLNINSLGAKAIYHRGAALKANVIRAGARVQLVYDGTNFEVLNFDAPYAQSNNTTKFYLLGTPNAESGIPSDQYFDTGVYVSATDGQLVAKSFSGNGSALTNLNAGNIASGTVSADRLPTSGATAGTYGENAGNDATLEHSGSLVVPKISLDKYGRITSAENIVYTMPANENTDEKVKVTQNATTKAYVTGTTTANGNTGGLLYDPNVYLDTTSGRFHAATMNSNTYYLGDTSNYIDSSKYTGTAANVGTLSEWLVDSCASDSANGVTNQALTANQGYLLQNQIDELNCNQQRFEKALHEEFIYYAVTSTTGSLDINTDIDFKFAFIGLWNGASYIKYTTFLIPRLLKIPSRTYFVGEIGTVKVSDDGTYITISSTSTEWRTLIIFF